MERAPIEQLLPGRPTEVSHHALAYDARHRSRRPVFELRHRKQRTEAGAWIISRDWLTAGGISVAQESVEWTHSLVRTWGQSTTLGEAFDAQVLGHRCQSQLTSHKTRGLPRARTMELSNAPVTLASMPLFIAQHWHRLLAGEACDASYLVLKVQRAATVRVVSAAVVDGERAVSATPRNPLLRALFGSTRYIFEANSPRLLRIEGLLDPRDIKRNGRWAEYLGTIEFDSPVDLADLTDNPPMQRA